MKHSIRFPECPKGYRLLVQDHQFKTRKEFCEWLMRVFGPKKADSAHIVEGSYDLGGVKQAQGFMAFIPEGTKR